MTQGSSLSERSKKTRYGSTGWLIQRLARVLKLSMGAKLSAYDLKIDHFVILMTLSERENVTQTELGQGISLPNYTITRALDFLESKGLVERRADAQSRRSHRVFLTPAGCDLMPALFDAVKDVNEAFLSPLSEEQGVLFNSLLQTLLPLEDQVKLPD